MKDNCPKCDYKKLKTWNDLTEEEKMVVKVKHSEFTLEERKNHLFCIRCGYEEINRELRT